MQRKSKESRFQEFLSRYREALGAKYEYFTAEHRSHLWAAWHDGFESRERDKKVCERKRKA